MSTIHRCFNSISLVACDKFGRSAPVYIKKERILKIDCGAGVIEIIFRDTDSDHVVGNVLFDGTLIGVLEGNVFDVPKQFKGILGNIDS